MEEGTITAILGSSVGLAGILLVFIGFVYSRVETFEQSDRVRKYRLVARLGALPFLLALISAWMCLKWLDAPSADLYVNAILAFKACLILTGTYGIVALVFYL